MKKIITIPCPDRWHADFYRHFIWHSQSWQCGTEGRAMHELLQDQPRMEQVIEEADVLDMEPAAAAAKVVQYIFS